MWANSYAHEPKCKQIRHDFDTEGIARELDASFKARHLRVGAESKVF